MFLSIVQKIQHILLVYLSSREKQSKGASMSISLVEQKASLVPGPKLKSEVEGRTGENMLFCTPEIFSVTMHTHI